MQETVTVTSDTALLEQKKIQNKHQDISQTLVKALFQTDSVSSEKGSKEVRSTSIKVSTKEDEVPLQERILVEQGLSEGATHLATKALLAPNPHITMVSMDDAARWQNSTDLDGHGTKVHNIASKTEGAINLGKAMVMLVNTKLPPQDNKQSNAQKCNTNSSTNGKVAVDEEDKVEIQKMAPTMAKKAVTFEVTTNPPAQPTKLSPKEWHALHDEWLKFNNESSNGG